MNVGNKTLAALKTAFNAPNPQNTCTPCMHTNVYVINQGYYSIIYTGSIMYHYKWSVNVVPVSMIATPFTARGEYQKSNDNLTIFL